MKSGIKYLFTALLILVILAFTSCTPQKEKRPVKPTLDAAQSVYMQLDLKGAQELYEKVAEDPLIKNRDRSKAMTRLAVMEWKFNKDITKARQWVDMAIKTGEETAMAYIYLSRIEREAGNSEKAKEAANQAELTAKSDAEKKGASNQFAAAVLKTAEDQKDGYDELLRHDLMEAMIRLSEVLDEEPGERLASERLLGIALLLDNGPMALKAWQSFYLVPDGDHAKGIMAAPGNVLENLLPGWENRPLLTSEREALILALADSGFYKYAAGIAADISASESSWTANKNPRIKEIIFYSQYLEDLEDITNEYYRKTAFGEGSKDRYLKDFGILSKELWLNLNFSDGRPGFDIKIFQKTLREKFGAVSNLGPVEGYFGLSFGHIVVNDQRNVVQYGHEAKFTFIAIDNMISNFYTSWFWDGAASVGGWAKMDTIYQVRESFAQAPFHEWRIITDPVERVKMEKEIQEKSAQDDELAMNNPYAYLPGLDGRLHLAALDRRLETVDEKGYEGSARCMAYVNEYMKIKMDQTIFSHEGRHCIDQKMNHDNFKWWKIITGRYRRIASPEMEFRAKLSEIAFSHDPRMAFCMSVFNNNMGDDTAHGTANLRIVKAMVEWMDQHRQEIQGFDHDRPLLLQFELLTQDQIRSAARAVDPLYLAQKEKGNI